MLYFLFYLSPKKCYANLLQVKEMLEPYHRQIMSIGALNEKTKPHNFRKGTETHATSGTTAGLSLSSVPLHGEWSPGIIFNIYIQFASAGKFKSNKYILEIELELTTN